MIAQAELFEPRPSEVGALVLGHVREHGKAVRVVEVLEARGLLTLAGQYRQLCAFHEAEIECLGMLSDFYRLGGVAA